MCQRLYGCQVTHDLISTNPLDMQLFITLEVDDVINVQFSTFYKLLQNTSVVLYTPSDSAAISILIWVVHLSVAYTIIANMCVLSY